MLQPLLLLIFDSNIEIPVLRVPAPCGISILKQELFNQLYMSTVLVVNANESSVHFSGCHSVSTLWKRRLKHLPQTVRGISADSVWATVLFTDHVISRLHHLVCCLDVMQSLFCSQLATVPFPISKWTLNENPAPPNSQHVTHQRADWSAADPVQCIQPIFTDFSLISNTFTNMCFFLFQETFFPAVKYFFKGLNYRYKRFAEQHLHHSICL